MNHQQGYLNLNELNGVGGFNLARSHKKGKWICPSCGGGNFSFDRRDGRKFKCFDNCSGSEIRRSILAIVGNAEAYENPEAKARREAAAAAAQEKERQRLESLRTEADRHKYWQGILRTGFLSPAHRTEMERRGYRSEWIEEIGAVSVADGRALPIRTAAGLMVGSQLKQDRDKSIGSKVVYHAGQKRWHGRAGTYHLRETHELPLAVVVPPNSKSEYIAYTESVYDKPHLAAYRFGMVTIGSSNIGSQPKDLERSIPTLCDRFGWSNPKHVLYPDGGAVANPGVMGCYVKLQAQLAQLGYELEIAWWGQLSKADGDIDEIPVSTPIKIISWEQFLQISRSATKGKEDLDAYERLSQCKTQPTTTYNEPFLPRLPFPMAGYITYVASGCGTGKTERLPDAIGQWRRASAKARVIDIVHRNSIKDGHQRRLGIEEYKVGYGNNEAALNHQQEVSVCLDSLLELKIEDLGRNPIVILDECEAILKHMAEGGTLGSRAAKVQAHFSKILDTALANGGIVLALEDSITDLAIEAINALTPSKRGYELYRNTAERFTWEVEIGSKNLGGFISRIVDRLATGERIIVPTTSQRFGEALERLVLERLPQLSHKIVRLDAKTSPDLHDLLKDPNAWLSTHQPQLLILSPTVESGFSISEGHFDRRMAYLANLDTRSHIQLLHRERSNIPTDIFCQQKGAEAGAEYSKNPDKLLRMWRTIANKTFLAQGFGQVQENEVGRIWNELAAKFKARSALSSSHSAEYLYLDLKARGHSLSPATWEADRDTANRLIELKHEIEVEENASFAKCDPIPDLNNAIALIHSSGISYQMRQRAQKRVLKEDLPLANLNDPDFTWVAHTHRNGAYRKACELLLKVSRPQIGALLDAKSLESHSEDPHQLFSKTPKNQQQIDLLTPIYQELLIAASGNYYNNESEFILKIQQYALKNWWGFRALFGLQIKPESKDIKGRAINRPVETVAKILKKLGFEVKSRRPHDEGVRAREYRAFDPHPQHRQTLARCWEERYKDLLIRIAEGKVRVPNATSHVINLENSNNIEAEMGTIVSFGIGDRVRVDNEEGTVELIDRCGYAVVKTGETTKVCAEFDRIAPLDAPKEIEIKDVEDLDIESMDLESMARCLRSLASIEGDREAIEGLADLYQVWSPDRMRAASAYLKRMDAKAFARLGYLVGMLKKNAA